MRTPLQTIVPLLIGLLLPCLAAAQTAGGITGVARDTSGAVLPGVTVEASSPALIEKVRVALTDGQGQFNITDLRPGTYTVTFTLPGFAPYKREGIELSTGFTATANAEMRVGTLEESVTVTGASPTVDIRNVRTQNVVTAEVLDALPSSGKNLSALASMTLGAVATNNDVGGDKNEMTNRITLHGGRSSDGRQYLDGMYTNLVIDATGGGRSYVYNMTAVQETVLDTGTSSAESETGGANLNLVPKEGGNQFSLYSTVAYSNHHFSAKGVSDELVARGAVPTSSLKTVYELGFGIGGPIKKDTLWFYSANQWWGAALSTVDNYFNKSANPYVYEPDLERPAYADNFYRDNAARLTWQAASKHKITQYVAHQLGCQCWVSLASGDTVAPEAAHDSINGPTLLAQTTWTYTATNKLLIQAGASFLNTNVSVPTGGYGLTKNWFTAGGTEIAPGPATFTIRELNTGYIWGAKAGSLGSYADYDNPNFNQRLSASYITGAHAAKVGVQTYQGTSDRLGMKVQNNNHVNYAFRNGVPASLTQLAGPVLSRVRMRSLGLFAQDQWTLKRLTLNVGVRFDRYMAYTPAIDEPAGPFIAARSVPEVHDVPNFTDVTPRFGAAYDLFGNGKTAIKAAFGKYLAGQGVGQAMIVGPATAIVQSVTRTWNDANRDFIPDCVLTNMLTNGECGQVNNLAFGQPVVNVTLADDARMGWGVREYNNQASMQLQHELRPGLGLAVGYFRTWWGNQTVEQNTAVTPSDFTEYCIAAPTDSRLNTSGERICGFYDVNPNKFGQVTRVATLAENFGTQEELYNGVDIAINANWGQGALLQGGVSVGRQTFDYCYVNGHPELTPQGYPASYPRDEAFCRPTSPWWDGSGSQIKLLGVYPLPWDVVVSGVFKHLPGRPISANQVIGSAQMAQILGRPLSACPATGACTATATHALIPAGGAGAPTQFDARLTQTDVRVSKAVRLGRGKIEGILDIYNLFNDRSPQSTVPTYGSAWLRPTVLLGGRLFKFGAQMNW